MTYKELLRRHQSPSRSGLSSLMLVSSASCPMARSPKLSMNLTRSLVDSMTCTHRPSVSVEAVGLRQPLPKLLINLIGARQIDQVDDPIGSSRQRTGDPWSVEFVREIEAQLHRPYARSELSDLAVTLEKDPHVDRILVYWPEICSDAR